MKRSRSVLFLGFVLFIQVGCDDGRSGSNRQPAAPLDTNVTFGERQLAQMLDDRPDMTGVLPQDHPVVEWIVNGFDGKRFGRRIYWNADSPVTGRPSSYASPSEYYPAQVYLSGGAETSPIDKWVALVFEFHNLALDEEFQNAFENALNGTINGEEYADRCIETEFQAALNTAEFFKEHPLPVNQDQRAELYQMFTTDFLAEHSVLPQGEKRSNSNYKYFKDYYDEVIRPSVRSNPD